MATPVPVPERIAAPTPDETTPPSPSTPAQAAEAQPSEPQTGEPKREPTGRDRRKRHRARVAMSVMIRAGIGSLEPFEDICCTIDASRDGLLVQTSRGQYCEGQTIEATFPYNPQQSPMNPPQKARVIRSYLMPDHLHYAVALEFNKAPQTEAGKAGQQPSTLARHVRVLAVEPDEKSAVSMRELLQADGYEVIIVESGKDALDFLRDETPDVLLAVVETGEISGLDLCAIMKKNVRLQHIPVILMTKSGSPSDYVSCHNAGAVMCMSKPCAPGKLQHAVRLVAPPPALRSAYSGRPNMTTFVRTS